MKEILLTLTVVALFGVASCATTGDDAGDDDDSDSDSGASDAELSEVNDWAYWLSDIELDQIAAQDFDLVVIDYSADGSEDEEFSAEDIAELKDAGIIVLAYMSIGEAEEGRFYFENDWVDTDTKEILPGAPDFLAASNPDFPDNFKVRFWQDEWQEIVFGYLDRIVEAGFDGVYLDIIDAFEFFGPGGEMEERESAGEDMIAFVTAIAERARETAEGFLVFPQNGVAILNEDGADGYLDVVSGIGAEDTFYFGEEDNDNDLDLDHAAEVTPYLEQFVDAGKLVLAIDYVQDEGKISDFYERALAASYVPYSSIRDLNELTINDGFEPD